MQIGNSTVKTTDEDASERGCLCFVLRLVLKHPTRSLEEISKSMGLEPHQGYSVGTQKMTPKGTFVNGINRETFFGRVEQFFDRKDFFGCAVNLAESLSERRDFFWKIRSEGGRVAIYIDLIGSQNVGDVLLPQQIEKISHLGMDFGVEVFP